MNYKNNPLNIRSSAKFTWIGQTSYRNGFCLFASVVYGIRAGIYLITRSYLRADENITVKDLLCRWAPASDGNDILAYRQFVRSHVGFDVETQRVKDLGDSQLYDLVRAMCLIESNYLLSDDIFTIALTLLKYEKN